MTLQCDTSCYYCKKFFQINKLGTCKNSHNPWPSLGKWQVGLPDKT